MKNKINKMVKRGSTVAVAMLLSCSMLSACKIIQLEPTDEVVESVPETGTEENAESESNAETKEIVENEPIDETKESIESKPIAETDLQSESKSDSEPENLDENESGEFERVSKANLQTDWSDGEILLLYRYVNHAWSFEDFGFVVDTNGRIIPFENHTFRLMDGEGGDVPTLTEYLDVIRENYEIEPFFDQKFVEEIQELGKDLSPDDEFETSYRGCDGGQWTYYYYNPETGKLLECQSKGDVDDIPKNESAKKIVRLFEDEVEKKAEKVTNETEKKLTNEIPSIFFAKECFMTEIEVSKATKWTGNRILMDEEMLRSFAEETGIEVDKVLDQLGDDIDKDNLVFFVEVRNTSDNKDVRVPKAVWLCGDCLDLIYEKEISKESDSAVCNVFVLGSELLSDNFGTFHTKDGNSWIIYTD